MNASCIRDVWAGTLEQEFAVIRRTIIDFPLVGLDMKFPGTVARPIGNFTSSQDYQYQTMRCNVDLLKVIQIAITLSDSDGNHPPEICTWQFNFNFNEHEDMCAPDSIEMMRQAGIDFPRHQEYGIKPNDFAQIMTSSGLVLSPETTWVTLNGSYQFGYLLQILTGLPLPFHESDFLSILKLWFPMFLDMKHVQRTFDKTVKGGLKEIAEHYQVSKMGDAHQAGQDSLVMSKVYFRMRDLYHPSGFNEEQCSGQLYGYQQTPTHGFGTGVGGASQTSTIYQQSTPSNHPSAHNHSLQSSTPLFTPALQQQGPNHFARMGMGITSGGG